MSEFVATIAGDDAVVEIMPTAVIDSFNSELCAVICLPAVEFHLNPAVIALGLLLV
ncbi:unnamed protein product [marine sediment metagenome]|uniref:Uncharacterized protein n=1 Tax=marine sediment metagenome TaxID=412755 RepID=X0WYJ1_9ZZZZ